MLRLRNQIYQKKNNIGADVLNRKPNYQKFDRPTKPMLVKNGDYMQVIETTEKNQNIIKEIHDTKLTGHQGVFKTFKKIKKKRHGKALKQTWKNMSKIAQFAQ